MYDSWPRPGPTLGSVLDGVVPRLWAPGTGGVEVVVENQGAVLLLLQAVILSRDCSDTSDMFGLPILCITKIVIYHCNIHCLLEFVPSM